MNRSSTTYKVLTTAVALMVISTLVTGVPQLDDDTTLEDTTGVQEGEAIAPILAYGAAAVAGGVITGGATYFLMGSEDVNETELAELDAEQKHTSLYQSLASVEGGDDITRDAVNNHLEDTEETALMIGKNAYVRSLNNGDSQSQAQIHAKEAVSDYYARLEMQTMNRWDHAVQQFENAYSAVQSESELDVGNIFVMTVNGEQSITTPVNVTDNYEHTLVNGTTINTSAVYQETYHSDKQNAHHPDTPGMEANGYQRDWIQFKPPTTDYTYLKLINADQMSSSLTEIESQKQSVHTDIETFIANTYDEYQVGEIDNGDLIDPYLGNREYSPQGDYKNWALRSLQNAGINTPQNLSEYGAFRIELEDGSIIEGILMSDGLPKNNTFEQGVTYNATQLNGTQYVIQDDGERELTGEFTILEVQDFNGEPVEGPIEYRDPNYSTTDLSEYKALMDALNQYNAEVDARQEKARDTSGGLGGLLPSVDWFQVGGVPGSVVIIGGFVALLLITRR